MQLADESRLNSYRLGGTRSGRGGIIANMHAKLVGSANAPQPGKLPCFLYTQRRDGDTYDGQYVGS